MWEPFPCTVFVLVCCFWHHCSCTETDNTNTKLNEIVKFLKYNHPVYYILSCTGFKRLSMPTNTISSPLPLISAGYRPMLRTGQELHLNLCKRYCSIRETDGWMDAGAVFFSISLRGMQLKQNKGKALLLQSHTWGCVRNGFHFVTSYGWLACYHENSKNSQTLQQSGCLKDDSNTHKHTPTTPSAPPRATVGRLLFCET